MNTKWIAKAVAAAISLALTAPSPRVAHAAFRAAVRTVPAKIGVPNVGAAAHGMQAAALSSIGQNTLGSVTLPHAAVAAPSAVAPTAAATAAEVRAQISPAAAPQSAGDVAAPKAAAKPSAAAVSVAAPEAAAAKKTTLGALSAEAGKLKQAAPSSMMGRLADIFTGSKQRSALQHDDTGGIDVSDADFGPDGNTRRVLRLNPVDPGLPAQIEERPIVETKMQQALRAARARGMGNYAADEAPAARAEETAAGETQTVTRLNPVDPGLQAVSEEIAVNETKMQQALREARARGMGNYAEDEAPAAGAEKKDAKKGKFWIPAIGALIFGLGIAQIAQEFLGQSMPQLIKETFGDFSVYASVMFFSLIGRTLGNAVGGYLPDSIGLRNTFLLAEVGRAITIGVLVTALITGFATLPMYFGLMILNGFFVGVTLTAEHAMPRVIFGDSQRLLEKFYGMYQWILEFAGIAAPMVAGYIIANSGTFAWTLGAYPLIMFAAISFFFFLLRHKALAKPAPGMTYDGKPKKAPPPAVWNKRYTRIAAIGAAAAAVAAVSFAGVMPLIAAGSLLAYLSGAIGGILLTIAGLRAVAAKLTKAGKKGGLLLSVDSSLGGVIENFISGGAIALKTPALRTAVLAEGGFIALNGFLYALIAPAYGLYIMGSATMAPSVQAFMVGLYSFGSMLGALLMLRFNKKIEAKVDAGEAGKAEEDAWMRRSTLRWMSVGALSLVAFLPLVIGISAPGTFLFGITGLWGAIVPIYLGMMLFGILSVVPTIKLKSLAARLTPSDSVPKVMGFIQLMSSMLIAFSVFGMSQVFDMFVDANDVPTQTAFWVMNGVLMAVSAGLLLARFILGRQLKNVPLAEDEPKGEAKKDDAES